MFENDEKECEFCDLDCKELIEKFLTICVPVKVTPCVEVKPVKAECCGKAIVTSKRGPCCIGTENGCCEFSIIQKMKVEIPIKFSANTEVNDPFVDCELKHDEHEHDIK